MTHPIIVIGAGLAGWTTVREFRKLDTSTPVVVVTADSGDFYAKPTLSNAYAQKRSPEQLVSTPAAKMVETLNVTLMAHTRVDALDVATQSITVTHDGAARTLPYRQLVLATGAQPIRVPVQGNASDQVQSINSLDDFTAFHSALSPHAVSAEGSQNASKTVVIMGAGLIGCEFANDLAGAGHTVHVADPSARPLAALLPAAAGEQLAQALGTLGDCAQYASAGQRTLPYVMPIMHAAKALAATLAGTPTEVVFPLMPVSIKTPALPIVVAAAHPAQQGEWVADAQEDGIWRFIDTDGAQRGFVLTGRHTARRMELAKTTLG